MDREKAVDYLMTDEKQASGTPPKSLPVTSDASPLTPHASRLTPGVFLDRDGVINRVVMRDGRPCSPQTIDEFKWEDGVGEAVSRLKEHGFPLIVVTNQPDIASGKMAAHALEAMTERVYGSLPIDLVCICPHDDIDLCECRKPKPGMLLDAARMWGIDCGRSFMVGDSWKDMEAGRAAGCTTILLDRPYNQGVACDHRVPGLGKAVELILGLCSSKSPTNSRQRLCQ